MGAAVDRGRWTGSVRWRYFGPRPLIEDDSVRSNATSLVNAQAGYHLTKQVTATMDVFNVTNAKDSDIDYFYTSRLPGEPLDGIADVHSHPALPRTIRAGLSISF
jgi:outer membrane receptor protein involved in Fe transport